MLAKGYTWSVIPGAPQLLLEIFAPLPVEDYIEGIFLILIGIGQCLDLGQFTLSQIYDLSQKSYHFTPLLYS